MEKFIRILLRFSIVLSILVSALLIVGGILFCVQGEAAMTRLIGGILCVLGSGILVSIFFSCLLQK